MDKFFKFIFHIVNCWNSSFCVLANNRRWAHEISGCPHCTAAESFKSFCRDLSQRQSHRELALVVYPRLWKLLVTALRTIFFLSRFSAGTTSRFLKHRNWLKSAFANVRFWTRRKHMLSSFLNTRNLKFHIQAIGIYSRPKESTKSV